MCTFISKTFLLQKVFIIQVGTDRLDQLLPKIYKCECLPVTYKILKITYTPFLSNL